MQTDELVAVRPGGSELRYSRTGEDGLDYGYIVDETGRRHGEKPVAALLARGYWEAPGTVPLAE